MPEICTDRAQVAMPCAQKLAGYLFGAAEGGAERLPLGGQVRRVSLVALAASAMVALAPTCGVAAPKSVAETVVENGFFFWMDGLYERVNLPKYSLGLRNVTNPPPTSVPSLDLGAHYVSAPRIDSGGVRGAAGFNEAGTGTRYEIGGSYVEGRGHDSFSSSSTSLMMLTINGGGPESVSGCLPGRNCNATTSSLSTHYSAWQLNGKASTDWRYGAVTFTPSLSVFGGETRAAQTLSQSVVQDLGFVVHTISYSSDTITKWQDVGARIGLDLNMPVTPALSLGVGGSVGAAARRSTFSGADVAIQTRFFVFGDRGDRSSLTIWQDKTAFLANAEANVVYRMTPSTTLRAFAGLNYDSAVPGIAGPAFHGNISSGIPIPRSAASLTSSQETNFYAGGGLRVTFGDVSTAGN